MPSPYDYHWQTVIRPNMLREAGGRFDAITKAYRGGAKCERCFWVEVYVPRNKRSKIEIAHLDGDAWNREPVNLATLCQTCHRANDYKQWAARCKATRSLRKDGARPLLQEATQ